MTTEAESKPASWMAEELLAEKERIKQAADMAAAGAQAEAQRIKAKMPIPPLPAKECLKSALCRPWSRS